ncbi:putative transmembrane protein [Senna tora]|uniref:Putative transmembrane protein n=1 Tax=Senna tora TaxID=362788 RepID=A0A834WG72_9FABA|nr:putative transmembrane protein [Senna tora]
MHETRSMIDDDDDDDFPQITSLSGVSTQFGNEEESDAFDSVFQKLKLKEAYIQTISQKFYVHSLNSRDSSNNLGLVAAIYSHSHNVYGFLIGLLLTLVGIKFNSSSSSCINNPFDAHMEIMVFFLETAVLYVISLTVTSRLRLEDHNANLTPIILKLICHVSGALGCELLVLILVTPIRRFIIINTLLALLLVTLSLCLYASWSLGQLHDDDTEEQERSRGTEMQDIEAGNILDNS